MILNRDRPKKNKFDNRSENRQNNELLNDDIEGELNRLKRKIKGKKGR